MCVSPTNTATGISGINGGNHGYRSIRSYPLYLYRLVHTELHRPLQHIHQCLSNNVSELQLMNIIDELMNILDI